MKSKIVNAGYVIRSKIAQLTHRRDVIQEEQIFFIHIPKTAGTTFLRLLYAREKHHLIFPNAYEHFIQNRGQHLAPQTIFSSNEIRSELMTRKWVVGHFTYQMAHQLSHKPTLITFLRNPFDRIVSEIAHLKMKSDKYHRLSIPQIMDKYKKIIGCRSAMSFGYQPRRENIEEAIAHLNECPFVGITEQYRESLDKCNRILGTRFKATSHQNVGNYHLGKEIAEHHGDQIKDLMQVDTRFYAAGKEIFQSL